MGETCRLSPSVFRRNGGKIEEVPSELYKDIKKAIQDNETAWKMWAYTKTSDFKNKYGNNVEFDELGEVTFPSLIKALGLEDAYNEQKDREEVARDYGFANKTFSSAKPLMDRVNEFNKKEDKFIAVITKKSDGYGVDILSRNATSINTAREQAFNNALNNEILGMMRLLGFNVGFVNNPDFEGLFDPTDAKLRDGLLEVIRIAKGEKGEEALPEEFSHLIIEGLINHPLVRRLLDSITFEQMREVLGDQYDAYNEKYEGDVYRIKKEVAGKMLADFIKKQGNISKPVMTIKKGFLSRIWELVKNLFSKVSSDQFNYMEERAFNATADIFNLVASGSAVPLIDKKSILNGNKLFKLTEKYNTKSKIAHAGLTINARVIKKERYETSDPNIRKMRYERHVKLKELTNEEESPDVVNSRSAEAESTRVFLIDTLERLNTLWNDVKTIQMDEENGYTSGIREINRIARWKNKVENYVGGYENLLETLATLDVEDNWNEAGYLKSEVIGEHGIATLAKQCVERLNYLKGHVNGIERNILYNACRTTYQTDIAKGSGKAKDDILALRTIIDHAERDINWVDRFLSSMADADDPFLALIDGLVKNQQYYRDMEMNEWRAEIAVIDKALRDAGYSSDFMYELDEKGVPTGKIISEYDWEGYREDLKKHSKYLIEKGYTGSEYRKQMNAWKGQAVDGKHTRVIEVYVNPEYQKLYEEGKSSEIPANAITEEVPNPKVYTKNANKIESLSKAQRIYYNKMMNIKRQMMCKIPQAGQRIHNVIYISKGFVEGILDNSNGNPAKATLDYCARQFTRRPDDIGFGVTDDFKEDIRAIIGREKNYRDAGEKIYDLLKRTLDPDIFASVPIANIIHSVKIHQDNIDDAVQEVLTTISSSTFYQVETDFANQRVKRLPVYYSRPLRDMNMLSLDFTSSITAYSAMAVNYEKMDEIVDILEVARDYSKDAQDGRKVMEREGDRVTQASFSTFGRIYHAFVERAASGTNIAARLDDYIDTVVYEERKERGRVKRVMGIDLDTAKTADVIKNYTGLLGLGLNIFSSISNLAVGKLQQWIECGAGEHFTLKDYAKAIIQYGELIGGCVAEMGSPVKKNKLSLLIQMFDPMGDYYESLRDTNDSRHLISRILGNNALAYIGMNAGEHILHCQTMLAILNNIKLVDTTSPTKEKISLYDALGEPVEVNGVYKLVMKEGLAYEREVIDTNGTKESNKNYGKPLKDENGKRVTELVPISTQGDVRNMVHGSYNADDKGAIENHNAFKNWLDFVVKRKRYIRKCNDMLNGAFGVIGKGAAHRKAVGRLILQFRQWMPAHYERRFASGHYDNDLEIWREGYYTTVMHVMNQIIDDLRKGELEYVKLKDSLSDHEKANLRRAMTEVSMFACLWWLCKLGGRVKDRDRSWLNKMALYQINRMKLEIGASMPGLGMVSDVIKLLNSPAASISTMEKLRKVFELSNVFDEVQYGRYKGWSEWQRDAFKLIPFADQFQKAWYFDDSMFSLFEGRK